MRRTVPVFFSLALLLAACGSDGDSEPTNSNDPANSTDTSGVDTGDSAPPAANPDKPEVQVPDEVPTELQVTVLREGSGEAAESGDTVWVDYVGVRTVDGVEFDNSYDRYAPLPVVVGTGEVIAGWDQGLIGAQAGAMLQLDIPSDLAYGETARSDIIRENEPLTFVIEVRAVVKPNSPEDEPTEPGVELSEGATELSTVDLVEGEGPEVQLGQVALIRYVMFRGDNGVALDSNWTGDALQVLVEEGEFPVFVDGLAGMHVGGERAITFPPAYPDYGFGPEGIPTIGLPAETDAIMVIQLVGAYDAPPTS